MRQVEHVNLQLWRNDKLTLDVRFSDYVGWEWTIRYYDDETGWSLLESGYSRSMQEALARAADALVDVSHAVEPF